MEFRIFQICNLARRVIENHFLFILQTTPGKKFEMKIIFYDSIMLLAGTDIKFMNVNFYDCFNDIYLENNM